MRVANLSFRYGRRDPWVLSGVELNLGGGDVVEITGINGTGKSTLLRLLAGLLRPVRGVIEDRPAVVGYAPERFPAGQPFTVAAYLRHMAAVRRVDPRSVGEWAERLGMDHLLDRRLPDLSKGSAHKVGLAQALLCRPGLLVLDEPFAGLDTATRAELPRVIGEVAAGGGIVVVSDHQGDLRALPGRRRHEVRDGAVREVPVVEEPPDDLLDAAEPATVLEVRVAASKAADLAERLRAEGHDVRTVRTAVGR
ncbi:MAG TPA: ATP-binding cassette domain-containing protein [Segeticoccus sp.]|uniref:ABC transporter ATP-binding protein n=1 Tax=Actinomycetes TaxID=1760 RepID=UPI0006E1D200|nr:ATP-binding cassette domain-containing protein [Segeticoccus sp.]HET8601531.1 ATP-binding cassette domain-containing protein [Segeticoccus sp.]